MANPIAIGPAVMVTRIAQYQGASLNTQLAKVAQLRMEMANALSEKAAAAPDGKAAAQPANGAEVDLLI